MADAAKQHPDWLAVGNRVESVRSRGGLLPSYRREVTIARHTKTSVVTTDGARYAATRYGAYILTPRYLDYVTKLEPLTPEGASSDSERSTT